MNHLILLHGPNGSAKSTLISCVFRALEYYSSTEKGAIYRFNWIFPIERYEKKALGFGGGDRPSPGSFAFLEESEISTKIQTDMKDHPLFLLPKRQRRELLERRFADSAPPISDSVRDGDLSSINRLIFDALLTSYNGDLERIYQHVQVERFFLSSRFRRGLVTVDPQLEVDASLRQITLDRSLESLPKVLQNMPMFEPFGDLVDANRGAVEFNDRLKRPVESFKYLLSTCEKSTVTLPSAILIPGHRVHCLLKRPVRERLQGIPRVAVVQGPHRAGAGALPPRLREGSGHLRFPGPSRVRWQAHLAPRHERGRPLRRADPPDPTRAGLGAGAAEGNDRQADAHRKGRSVYPATSPMRPCSTTSSKPCAKASSASTKVKSGFWEAGCWPIRWVKRGT